MFELGVIAEQVAEIAEEEEGLVDLVDCNCGD